MTTEPTTPQQEAFYEAIWTAGDMSDADKAYWLYEAAKHHDEQRRWWEDHCRRQATKNVELRVRVEALTRALSDLVAVVDSDDTEAGTDLVALEAAIETDRKSVV